MAARNKDELSRDTFLNLVRLHERLNSEFAELFAGAGLTGAQYNVLRILRGGPNAGVPCQEISAALITRVPDVTRLIDRMVKAELVSRQRSEEDRRVVRIRLSPKGRRVCQRLDAPTMELHRRQFDHLSAKALAALHDGLTTALERE